MKTVAEVKRGLAEAWGGSDQFYRHWLGKVYSLGVYILAENADCYWLLDVIFSYHRKEPFQVWKLKKTGETSAVVTMVEDSGRPVKVKQEIEYTDFPLDEITLWLENGVLTLPQEH